MSEAQPRLVARNAAVRVIGEVLAKVASLAFYVTMARELGAAGFGAFQFALALTGALVFVAGFGTDSLLAREVARDRARAGRLLADAAAVKLIGGALMLGVAAIVVGVGHYSATERAAVYIVGAGSLLEVLSKSWYSIFQGYERLELVSATLILQRTVTAVAGILVLTLGGGLLAASAVYAGGSVAAVAAAEVWLRRLGVRRARTDRAAWPGLLRAGIPIGAISLLMTLLLRVDVTMLSFLSNAATVGIYAVAFRLVEATQFIGAAVAAAMLPWLSRTAVGAARGYALGLKAVNALLFGIGLAFLLFAAPLIRLLYGPAYHASVLPLQLMAMTTALYGINAFASVTLIARDRPLTFAKLLIPVIVVNLGLNAVLIPAYGADGAAFDALASSLLLAALALWQARVVLGPADLVGAFSGPVAGGAAMVAVVLALRLPWPVEAVLGGAAYVTALAACEWLTRRDDARLYLSVLGSRSRAGRTTA